MHNLIALVTMSFHRKFFSTLLAESSINLSINKGSHEFYDGHCASNEAYTDRQNVALPFISEQLRGEHRHKYHCLTQKKLKTLIEKFSKHY
jgi:hypothetical protein